MCYNLEFLPFIYFSEEVPQTLKTLRVDIKDDMAIILVNSLQLGHKPFYSP